MPDLGATTVLLLDPTLAQEFISGNVQSPAAKRLLDAFSGGVESVAPGSLPLTPSEDGFYLSVPAANMDAATRLADRLRELPGVKAAFPKPGEELP